MRAVAPGGSGGERGGWGWPAGAASWPWPLPLSYARGRDRRSVIRRMVPRTHYDNRQCVHRRSGGRSCGGERPGRPPAGGGQPGVVLASAARTRQAVARHGHRECDLPPGCSSRPRRNRRARARLRSGPSRVACRGRSASYIWRAAAAGRARSGPGCPGWRRPGGGAARCRSRACAGTPAKPRSRRCGPARTRSW